MLSTEEPHPETESQPARRVRALPRVHLALPGLLTALYCFRAGGYFPFWTGVGATALGLALVLRVTSAERPFSGWSPAATVAGLGAAGLASWTLVSAAWSHAPERALTEFDRTLLYGLLFGLVALAPRRPGDLNVMLRWVLAAFTAACLAGLGSRIAPDLVPISGKYVAERLSFPLTYWNATGLAAALAVVLGLHHAAGSGEPRWVRVAAAASLPVSVATLYFTFSRGAIAACVLGLAVYLVLGASRRLAIALAATVVPVAVGLWAAWDAGLLATADYAKGAGPAQGHHVAVILAGCVAAAAALRWLAGLLEERAVAGPPPISPRTALKLLAAGVVLLLAVAIALGAPARLADEARTFGKGDVVTETGDARDRLTTLNSNGRPDLWRTSLDAFARRPLLGTGAGTFRLVWQQERRYFWKVGDGHSLYFELLGELGLVGGITLLLLLLTPIVIAVRRLRGPERTAYAAFIAAGLTLLVHAGVDWDWEMPALFCWYFGAAGVVVARPARDVEAGSRPTRSTVRLVAGLACVLLAVTPALLVLSQSRLDRAFAAFRAGDCATAVDSALSASETLPRAQASEIIGYCDLRAGQNALAVRAMRAASTRDPENWQYEYGLAIALAISGKPAQAAADTALRLNSQEQSAQDLAKAMASRSAKRRYDAAARATIPSE